MKMMIPTTHTAIIQVLSLEDELLLFVSLLSDVEEAVGISISVSLVDIIVVTSVEMTGVIVVVCGHN